MKAEIERKANRQMFAMVLSKLKLCESGARSGKGSHVLEDKWRWFEGISLTQRWWSGFHSLITGGCSSEHYVENKSEIQFGVCMKGCHD